MSGLWFAALALTLAVVACKNNEFSGNAPARTQQQQQPQQQGPTTAPPPAPNQAPPPSNDEGKLGGRESVEVFEARCKTRQVAVEEQQNSGADCSVLSFQILTPGDPKACSVARASAAPSSSIEECKELCRGGMDTSEGPAYCVYKGQIIAL